MSARAKNLLIRLCTNLYILGPVGEGRLADCLYWYDVLREFCQYFVSEGIRIDYDYDDYLDLSQQFDGGTL